MPPEIGPIGDSSVPIRKVEPINWVEKSQLNERRVPAQPGRPTVPGQVDVFTPSDELVPLEILENAPKTAKADAPRFGPNVAEHGAPQIDAPQLDAAQIDAPQLDAPQLDAAQIDAPQLDAAQIDAPTPTSSKTLASSNVAAPKSLTETSTAELKARRIALIRSGTAKSMLELMSVTDELAARGHFRSASPIGAAPVPGTAPGVEGGAPGVEGGAPGVERGGAPFLDKTVKLAPSELPPEVRAALTEPSLRAPCSSSGISFYQAGTYALGAFAFVGGLLQFNHGLNELTHENYLDGSVYSLAGVCNTTAGGAMFSKIPSGCAIALRAGGAGAILEGGLQLYKGYTTGDEVRLLDGGVRTSLGATMLTGGVAAGYAGSAYAGWSFGRFIGERKICGNKTVDDVVTDGLYNLFFA